MAVGKGEDFDRLLAAVNVFTVQTVLSDKILIF